MGRVYAVDPKPGERSGRRCRVEWLNTFGGPAGDVWNVIRVAFDADADEGGAVVTVYATDKAGVPITCGDHVATATFWGLVRVTPPLRLPALVCVDREGRAVVELDYAEADAAVPITVRREGE